MKRAGRGSLLALLAASLIGATASAQEPTPETLPTAEPASAGWVQLDAPVLAGLDAIEQAATTSDGEVIVVGSRCATNGTCRLVAIASSDGSTWEARGLLPAEVNLLADIVADEDGLLAVGNDVASRGYIWRSSDGGTTWAPVGDRDVFAPGADGRARRSPTRTPYDVSVTSLARGPGGLVAGGWLNSEEADRSAIWRSTDPEAWEPIRLPRAMDRAGGVFDVAGSAAGYVAVTAQGLWRSEDGRRWLRVRARAMADEPVTDVEATDDGFIGLAVGPSTPAVWLARSDGTGWERVADDAALAGLWEGELRTFGPRVLIVGSRSEDVLVPTLWMQQPDSAWTAATVSSDTEATLTDLTLLEDEPLVVGSVSVGDEATAGAAWRAEPAS